MCTLQARLSEAQQQLTAANAALQQLNRQMHSINTQEKQAIGAKSRAAHKVQQLQVRPLIAMSFLVQYAENPPNTFKQLLDQQHTAPAFDDCS